MKDLEDNEVSISSNVSGPFNWLSNLCAISMSVWEVRSPLVLCWRTIVPNCVVQPYIVVGHGH